MDITNYDDLLKFQRKTEKERWIYRGENHDEDGSKLLRTSLEKAFGSIYPSITGAELANHKIIAEKDVIREFQRKLHLYTDNIPTRADILQWLALMQHHGAPTRLLDWTYSFWVAVHFATTYRAINDRAVIWAINTNAIWDEHKKFKKSDAVQIFSEEKKITKEELPYCDLDAVMDNAVVHYLIENPKKMVYFSNPFRQNQRLTLQQGVFLITGDITQSFQDNLYCTKDRNDETYSMKGVITLNNKLKEEIVRQLREMNINNAVLFPSLDGFSQSLRTRIGVPQKDRGSIEEKALILIP